MIKYDEQFFYKTTKIKNLKVGFNITAKLSAVTEKIMKNFMLLARKTMMIKYALLNKSLMIVKNLW